MGGLKKVGLEVSKYGFVFGNKEPLSLTNQCFFILTTIAPKKVNTLEDCVRPDLRALFVAFVRLQTWGGSWLGA